MTPRTHYAKGASTLCRRLAVHKHYITTDISKVNCRTCIKKYDERPVPVLTTAEESIFTIYFSAWAADGDIDPKAYSPYLKFTTSVSLEEAISVAVAIKIVEPRHLYAIGIVEEHGWHWKEKEGRVDLGVDVR
ncbi:hypothetical protein LCGC14_0347490 [marine sediment metagenome]|uniref:Uncharacterized protein n=1 Tax=marine sediment metagenome TaxID=412755 RepID=A0A0F9TUP3_9ZZZZ